MIEDGFFFVNRGVFDHYLFNGEPYSQCQAWLWMIGQAAWKPRRYRAGQFLVNLERGQLCASVRHMAEKWGWSKSSVHRFLERLKTETMIGTDSGTGVLVVTICNYEKYQVTAHDCGTANGTLSGTVAGQSRDSKEEGNKYNNKKPTIVGKKDQGDSEAEQSGISGELPKCELPRNPQQMPDAKPSNRATKLATDWQPTPELKRYAIDQGLTPEQAKAETEKFRLHWLGNEKPMKNWGMTYKKWMITAGQQATRFKKPPDKIPQQPLEPAIYTRQFWTDRLNAFRLSRDWPKFLGPSPEQTGCRVPAEILELFNEKRKSA